MKELPTWQTHLGSLITTAQERHMLALALGIHPTTLTRWITGAAQPRRKHLFALRDIFIEKYPFFVQLLIESHPFLQNSEPIRTMIPSEFFTRVLHANAVLPVAIRKMTLQDLILQQILSHLNPRHYGMAAFIVQCMPPGTGHYIRSLRVIIGRGTSPWESHLKQGTSFLGAESFVGQAVQSGQTLLCQPDEEKHSLFSVPQELEAKSLLATPIIRGDQVAGCLCLLSLHPADFSEESSEIIQAYLHLLVIAFAPDEFYAFDDLALEIMPPHAQQAFFLQDFHQRVSEYLRQCIQEQHLITRYQAEMHVLQEIEEELIQQSKTHVINFESKEKGSYVTKREGSEHVSH